MARSLAPDIYCQIRHLDWGSTADSLSLTLTPNSVMHAMRHQITSDLVLLYTDPSFCIFVS